ncbi:MAG: methyltransferase domain-containing protein [Chloroflexi bacterium]|nr:methyltransferase domain-containing protein [Chloroflexota bacterium]
MSAALPPALADAVDALLAEVSPPDLARARAALTARYRDPHPRSRGGPVARTQADVLAYLAARLPATFAAVGAALAAVGEQRPGWQPRTLLDLGTGPGTALWAAVARWSSVERTVALEAEPRMLALGRRLAASAPAPAMRDAAWLHADLAAVSDGLLAEAGAPFDLVMLAYVLGELPPERLTEAVALAHEATTPGGVTLIIEPGTPAGFARVRDARALLVGEGGHVVAPCPHDAPCPVVTGDWCHFSARLARTAGHRAAKGGALGYEDEKYAYIAVSHTPVAPAPARIIRHPRVRPRLIELSLCTPDGLDTRVVTKSDREGFRLARKAAWGAAWSGE